MKGNDDVNWDLENYEYFGQPVVYQYEYDFQTLLETDPNYMDFLPASVYRDDLEFHELSTVKCLVNPETVLLQEGEEIKEPCQAALAIEANLPTPSPKTMSYWRTFISTALYHPNILAHSDVKSVKELFQLFGSDIHFENAHFILDLEKNGKDYTPTFNIRPTLPSSQKAPIVTFAHIRDFLVEIELKTCIVKDYCIMDFMKNAVEELTNFIIEFPEALYLETYGFVLDFFLMFGIQSNVIIDAVMRTQRRRRKSQYPASVLILKQANRLGKGKKEFLQQKLLGSPDKKFDPVIPFVTEPTPVRHLRNRRTGLEQYEHTLWNPTVKEEVLFKANTNNTQSHCDFPTSSNSSLNPTTSLVDNSNTTIKKKHSNTIKRKLKYRNASGNKTLGDNAVKEKYVSRTGVMLSRRKKRFYHRRDDSLLEKAFSCTICENRTFTYKGNLVVHMKKHHSDSAELQSILSSTGSSLEIPVTYPFSCPVCLVGFQSKYSCRRHLRKYHPGHVGWDPLNNEEESNSKNEKDAWKLQQALPVDATNASDNSSHPCIESSDLSNQTSSEQKLGFSTADNKGINLICNFSFASIANVNKSHHFQTAVK